MEKKQPGNSLLGNLDKIIGEINEGTEIHEKITGEQVPLSWKLPKSWIGGYLIVNFLIIATSVLLNDERDRWEVLLVLSLASIPLAGIFYILAVYQQQWLKLKNLGGIDKIKQREIVKANGGGEFIDIDEHKVKELSEDYGLNIGNGILWNGEGHIVTFGAARSGKGTCLIAPALTGDELKHDLAPSFMVLDPKGENIDIAGDYLQSIGYKVICLNPFGIRGISRFGNASFNPLLSVDPNSLDSERDINKIAYSIIPESNHENKFFDDSARDMIINYMKHLVTQSKDEVSFRTLYSYVNLMGEMRDRLIMEMVRNGAYDRVIAEYGLALKGHASGGGASLSEFTRTAQTALSSFANIGIRRSLGESDFSGDDFDKQKLAVFVCIPPEEIAPNSAWLRIMFGTILRDLTRIYHPKRRTILLMDEFNKLGSFKEIDDFMSYGAHYATVWAIVQNIGQLKNNYHKTWETFLGNTAVKQWVKIDDNETRDYLSKRLPTAINFIGKNADASHKYVQKNLLKPDELGQFGSIILEAPMIEGFGKLTKIPYWIQNNNGKNLRI